MQRNIILIAAAVVVVGLAVVLLRPETGKLIACKPAVHFPLLEDI